MRWSLLWLVFQPPLGISLSDIGAAFGFYTPNNVSSVASKITDAAPPSAPPAPSGPTAEELAAQASHQALQQQAAARRRRRRASLLTTMGMGDMSELPMTLPTATPGKPTLGA